MLAYMWSWNDGFFPKKHLMKNETPVLMFLNRYLWGLYPEARPFQDQLRNDVTH